MAAIEVKIVVDAKPAIDEIRMAISESNTAFEDRVIQIVRNAKRRRLL